MARGTVLFSHGLHSGPRAAKIQYLAGVAGRAGWRTRAVDCEGVMDPEERVRRLVREAGAARAPLVLAGSSLGGWVSVAASAEIEVEALMLMAPAIDLPGLPEPAPRPRARFLVVAHGRQDDVVPVDGVAGFARRWRAELHLLDDGHALAGSLEFLGGLLAGLLHRVEGYAPSA